MRKRFTMLNLCFIVGLTASWATGNAQSQGDTIPTHQLHEVTVTEKVRPATTRQAAPLQIINRAGFERTGMEELTEAVRHFSGVSVKDYGGIGGLKTVSVRNLGTQHTGVSYDGIAVNDCQSGQVDLGRFSLDNVESVSLAIGQTDRIFQTARMFASAGALYIQTAAPVFTEKPFHAVVKVKGGSFGLINPSVRHEQRLSSRFVASVQADWLSAKGDYPFMLTNGQTITHEIRKNSDVQSLRIEGNIYGEWDNNRRLTAKIYHYNAERGLPGSVILYNDYARERLWDKNSFAQVHFLCEPGSRFHWQALAKFNHAWTKYLDVSNLYVSGRQEDRHLQREYYASASAGYFPADRWSFALNGDFFVNTLHSNFPECPFPVRYTTLGALAVQYRDERLTVVGSLLGTYMVEYVHRENERVNNDTNASSDREDGTFSKQTSSEWASDRKRLSPALSASWLVIPDKNLRFRASYKDIYRSPTFNDLYYLRVGNKNLRPERATQYNIGFTWSGGLSARVRYVNVTVDGYHNRVHDKISAIPTLYVWKMMNLGEVSIYGLDVNLQAESMLTDAIKLFFQGSYSLQKAIDITNETAKNYRHQIPYTPRHSGSASVTLDNPWVNVSYNTTAVSSRYALPENIPANEIKGHIEQSVTVYREWRLNSRQIRIQAEIINLGNVQYDVIKFYPMPGRSYRLSLKYTL